MIFKCGACDAKGDFPNRHEASMAGWALLELFSKGRVKYGVYCPNCHPPFVKQVLGDGKRHKE